MKYILCLAVIFSSSVFAEIKLDASYLKAMLTKKPKDSETQLLLAGYYFSVNALDKSNALFLEVLKNDADNLIAKNLKKRWLLAKESSGFSRELSRNHLHNTLGFQKVDGGSTHFLSEFTRKYPDNNTAHLFVAQQFASDKQVDLAIKTLQSIQKKTPEVQFFLATYQIFSGKHLKQAQRTLKSTLNQTALMEESPHADVLVNEIPLLLAKTYLWQGDKVAAQKILSPLLKIDPTDSISQAVYFRKAQAIHLALKSQSDELLMALYKEDLEANPANTQILLQLARFYEKEGISKNALRYYKDYLSIKKADPSVEKSMGLLYLAQKKYEQGFRFLKRHAYRQHTEESLFMLAEQYHKKGFNQESLMVIKKLLAYYPKADIANQLKETVMTAPLAIRNKYLIVASKAYQKEDYNKAVPFYERYLERYANDGYIRNRYAFSLGKIGRYLEAIDEFSKVIQIKPEDLNAQYYYAYNLEKLAEYKLAKAMYIQIVKKTGGIVSASLDKPSNENKAYAKLNKLAGYRLEIIEQINI